MELPTEIYVAPNQTGERKAIPIQGPNSKFLETLGDAMTQQWGFLHERATSGGAPHVNTLTRYAYNTFGIRRILQRLERQDVREARVLLVTAYETPLHELLSCDRVREVVAIDISRAACQVVSDNYAQHPQAGKIRLRIIDYSGLKPEFQEIEALELTKGRAGFGRPTSDSILGHFSRIASGQHFADLDFESDSFDALHLPFVLGSLYLGLMTIVIGQYGVAAEEPVHDYTDFIGKDVLRAPEAQQAALSVINHALNESRRITKPGGLIVVNMWARPQPDDLQLIRLSDTPVRREAFDQLMQRFRRLFSGNPQPTLPHTVGHIFTSLV